MIEPDHHDHRARGFAAGPLDELVLEAAPGTALFEAFAEFAKACAPTVSVNDLWGLPDLRTFRFANDLDPQAILDLFEMPAPILIGMEIGWLKLPLTFAITIARISGQPLARLYNDGTSAHFLCKLADDLGRPE